MKPMLKNSLDFLLCWSMKAYLWFLYCFRHSLHVIVDEIYMMCGYREGCSVTNVMSLKKWVTCAGFFSWYDIFSLLVAFIGVFAKNLLDLAASPNTIFGMLTFSSLFSGPLCWILVRGTLLSQRFSLTKP